MLGISESTLRRRFKGGKSRAEGQQEGQLLSPAEEKALARWITCLTVTGHPASHALIEQMAEEIRQRRIAKINDDGMELISYPPIGNSWVPYFISRHPHLKTTLMRSIEANRIKVVTKEAVKEWFAILEEVCAEAKIKIENVYNMDETGIH